LPMSSRSRSRRTTSTSGSSGIAVSLAARRRECRSGALFRLESFPCRARCRLLGLLLGPSFAVAVSLAAQRHRGVEALGVVGSLGAHLVARQLIEPARCDLLQARLEVLSAGAGSALADPIP